MRIEELEAQAAASKRVCEMLIHEHTERQRERDAALEQVAEMTARAEKAEAHAAALREVTIRADSILSLLFYRARNSTNWSVAGGELEVESLITALRKAYSNLDGHIAQDRETTESLKAENAMLKDDAAFGFQCRQDSFEGAYVEATLLKEAEAREAALRDILLRFEHRFYSRNLYQSERERAEIQRGIREADFAAEAYEQRIRADERRKVLEGILQDIQSAVDRHTGQSEYAHGGMDALEGRIASIEEQLADLEAEASASNCENEIKKGGE